MDEQRNKGSRPRVLIVDDVPANLVVLVAQLDGLDCELVRATSGSEALKLLHDGDYAVVLLDVQMPDIDGYQVARHARANVRTRDIPIIFLTAMVETEENMLRGYGTGAVDVLFKPANPTILRSKVQVFLELQASRARLAAEIEAHRRTMADLESFNYSVSHDLRAPLRAVEGFSRILKEEHGASLGPDGLKYLSRVLEAAHTMDRLIQDLLRLSRVLRADLTRTKVDLSALVRRAVERLEASDPKRRVDTVVEDGIIVDADAGLLAVVVDNLLGNAWKFTSKKPHARIEFGRLGVGPRATYFVRDDGAGFDPTYSKKLFGVFQRLHSTTEFDGTGIGLATVNRIVTRHGGRVWAEGRPNEGAVFNFTLGEESLK